MLLTEQTGEMFRSSLPIQHHHSATDNAEARICFCYYPADAPAVRKFSAANNETHTISMGLTPKETMIAMNLLYQAGLITSSEFFGIDCCKDINNHSGKVAVQLIGTLFGAKSL